MKVANFQKDYGKLAVKMKKLLIIFLLISCLSANVAYSDFTDLFVDKKDGMLDVSELLNSKWGFMPVVIPITEPAVGYGAVGAGIWFHDQLTKNSHGQLYIPSVSGVMALATENGSRGFGGFHMESWADDAWGYTGIIFDGDINLQIYDSKLDKEFGYNLKGFYTEHQITRTISRNLSLGLAYQYSTVEVLVAGFALDFEDTNVAVELELSYDALDNPISPMNGLKVSVTYEDFNERWGGDADFSKIGIEGQYHKTFNKWHFGINLTAQKASDDTPFYLLPSIGLRGVPAMSYIGSEMQEAELQIDYQFAFRWSAVVFGGIGKADFQQFEDLPITTTSKVSAGGIGFRYLLARDYGMRGGIDYAVNSDGGNAIYFQVGSAW